MFEGNLNPEHEWWTPPPTMETTTSLFPIYLRHACNLYEVQFIVVTDRAGAVLFYSVYFIVFGGINVQGI